MTESSLTPTVAPTRRELLATMCLLALAVLFCFRELAEHPTHLLVGAHRGGENDLTAYFLRALDWPRQEVSHGRLPGWNPHLLLGGPTWGNPQSLLFYPPNWLCWWLGSAVAASWLLVAHHWWAGVGSYLWARQLGVRHASAWIAGTVGAAAPYAIAHTAEGHYPQTCVMSWLPWTFWAFERFLTSGGQKWLGVSVCLAFCFLGGHVQESFYLALLLSGTLACCWLNRVLAKDEAQREGHARLLSLWSLAGVATIGLVLVELLPTFSNSQLSMRASGLPLSLAGDGLKSSHWSLLWDSSSMNSDSHGTFGGWEFCFHFGLVPGVLVVLALLCGRQRPGTRRLLWMLAITVLFAFGARSPLFRMCHAWLPGVASFRSPARALYLGSMIVSVLAALGWDSLWPRVVGERPSRRSPICWASLLVLGLIVWELGTFSSRVLATIPASALRHESSISKFLREQRSSDRVLSGIGLYDDREAHQDGVQKVLGYEPFMFLRYALFLDALTPDGSKLDPGGFQLPSFRDLRRPLLDLAGGRYAIMPADQPEIRGWKRVATGTVPAEITLSDQTARPWSYAIFENQSVLPRAFVIGRVTETANASQGQKLPELLARINPRETLLLQRDIWPHDSRRTPFVAATIESYSNNEVRVRANSDGHGYLVLTDLFHPGWSATVDGQPTAILPADIAFRAVPLTPGEHSIVFRFVVPGWKAGVIVSSLSWLAAICLTAVSIFRPSAGTR